MDVTTYYTKLVKLWEEYKNLVDLLACTCGKCECNSAALWEKLQEWSRVMKFLMGLNESYDASWRHILMIKPIPFLEDVFNMITQDERQKWCCGVSDYIYQYTTLLVFWFFLFWTFLQVKLAKHLVASSFADHVFFCNSGTKANKAGINFLRMV